MQRSSRIAASLLLVACGGSASKGAAPAVQRPAQTADAGPSVTTNDVPSIEALVARGASEAPMMREASRSPDVKAPIELQAGTADTCYRALVAANEPVTTWFEADDHDRRGAAFSGTNGLVPPAGPVCFRKGERLRLIVERPNEKTLTRAVVWASP